VLVPRGGPRKGDICLHLRTAYLVRPKCNGLCRGCPDTLGFRVITLLLFIAMSTNPLTSATKPKTTGKDALQGSIEKAKSHNLVFGIVGHVGAGATYVAAALSEELESTGYQTLRIKPSELIAQMGTQLNLIPANSLHGVKHQRTDLLQKAGDELRKRYGPTIVASLAINHIHVVRKQIEPQNKPVAFIIDSLKHPHEVKALQEVYRNSFYLLSVICGPELRLLRLKQKYKETTEQVRRELANHDEASPKEEGQSDYKQNTRDTLQHADFFVSNEEDNDPQTLASTLSRIIHIITGQTTIRPTRDERGMHAAWSAALRSTCLSRPVGAAILNEAGELIATGTNDVPKPGGGLYQDGESKDARCFSYKEKQPKGYCRNDFTKKLIYKEIFTSLQSAKLLKDGAEPQLVQKAIEQTSVRDLIEFSRAVHAEMDAILSLARSGGETTQNATLYSTTYPCHSCARHIVGSGIREVVYIEPYQKSRAKELHPDSIEETTKRWTPNSEKVHFRLFSGVAPRRFAAVFQRYSKLKDAEGLLIERAPNALHQDPVFSRDLAEFEMKVAEYVNGLTNRGDGGP